MNKIVSRVNLFIDHSFRLYVHSLSFYLKSLSVFASNGVSQFNKLKRIAPTDQTSAFYVYSYLWNTWGAMYNTVPQHVLFNYSAYFNLFENPKSAILTIHCSLFKLTFLINTYLYILFIWINSLVRFGKWIMIFSSLRSLWMTLTLIISWRPVMNYHIIYWIIWADTWYSLASISSWRLPPLQCSRII